MAVRKFILLILLMGAFLGGYHLGRTPGSPDVFSHARRTYRRASHAGKALAGFINARSHDVGEIYPVQDGAARVDTDTHQVDGGGESRR